MKLVIDIDEEIYKDIMIHNREMREGGKSAYYFEELIQNGTPLPDNATNEDIFLLTHPNVVATEISRKGYLFNVIQLRNKAETLPFAEIYIDWWNAPYRKEVKDEVSN